MKKVVFGLFCFFLVFCYQPTDAVSKTSSVTIYRDGYGAPHIFSRDLEGLFYGFGYATAQDRLFQMDMLRRTYWGRVSEAHGAKFLEFDKSMRRDNLSRAQVRDQIGALDKAYQIVLRSYADGINACIGEIRTDPSRKMPAEFIKFGIDPEKWEAEDVAAVFNSVMGVFMDFSKEIENQALFNALVNKHGKEKGQMIFKDTVWGNDPNAFVTISPTGKTALSSAGQVADIKHDSIVSQIIKESELNRRAWTSMGILPPGDILAASYAFVVSGNRSSTGNPILMGGPQFGFHLPSDLYEAGLHGPGINVVGSTLVGYPVLMFGHNEKSAFSSTAGVDNITDIFEEKLNPGNPHQYWFMGKWRTMDGRKEIFKIKNEAAKEFTFYYTVHGPVIRMDENRGIAYSKQLACKEDYLSGFVSFYELMKAGTPDDFRKAAASSSLAVNVYYADTSGNIGYFHQGKYPNRSSKVNPLFPTPGTGEFEWLGFLPTDKNPHVINPSSGIIANWNNKPAKDWWNGDLGGIFGGVAGWGLDQRASLLMDSVKGIDKISVQDLRKMIQDITFTHIGAHRFKPFLLEAGKGYGGADPRIKRALELLGSWDNKWSDTNNDGLYDHPGLTIFNSWWDIVLRNTFSDELGEYWSSLETSYGGPYNWEQRKRYAGNSLFLRALLGKNGPNPTAVDYFNGKKDEILITSLSQALDRAEKKLGPDMSAWRTPVTPMSYAPTTIHGVTSTTEQVKPTFFMDRGTENHIVELKKDGPKGIMSVPPGTSGFVRPDGMKSPYYEDQLSMFNRFEYKPLLLKEESIKTHAKSQQTLTYTYE